MQYPRDSFKIVLERFLHELTVARARHKEHLRTVNQTMPMIASAVEVVSESLLLRSTMNVPVPYKGTLP